MRGFMILNKVSIRNFRQYRKADINFAKGDGKNFTIIQGNNGTGKTTLLNALSWCLYGDEIHDYGDAAAMTICNNKAANLAYVGEDIEVSVELEFIDDGEYLSFHRVQGFRKNNNGVSRNSRLDKFVVKQQDGTDVPIRTNPYYIIERKIPEEIEDYFFFDGARLSEYFQKTKNDNIKNAVFSLSQLNLLKNSFTNLPKVKDKYISDQKAIAPKLGKAAELVNEYEKSIEKAEIRKQKASEENEIYEREIKEIDQQLIDRKSSDVEKDVLRNGQLDREIRKLNKKISDLEVKRTKHVLTKYPFVMSYQSFINFLDKGEESREKGYIPPKFKKSFIEDLLKEGKCICGTDLNVDIEHRKALEKLLEETNPLTDSAEELTVALNQVKEVIVKDIKKFKSISLKIHTELRDLNNELDELIEEKKDIESHLQANPIEEIRDLSIKREKIENLIKTNNQIISNTSSEIDRLSKKLGEQRKLLNKEKKLAKDYDDLNSKIEFCEKAIPALKDIYDELKEDIRVKVQDLTKEKFVKISWKDEEFVDIIINKDYEVFIENSLGQLERPGDLSDGEKLSLGLCFMSALHNISGFDLPIIMDTPLGNLDVDMRHNIAEFLPKFVGDKQTVLLVTGTEYTDDFRDTLFRAVGKEYVIDWDNSENGKESKVKLVYGD